MALRIRVSTIPPLPQLKFWYPVPHLDPPTIYLLKTTLLDSIPALAALTLSPERLSLHIDQYALLDHSDVSVLRDGDLLSQVFFFIYTTIFLTSLSQPFSNLYCV